MDVWNEWQRLLSRSRARAMAVEVSLPKEHGRFLRYGVSFGLLSGVAEVLVLVAKANFSDVPRPFGANVEWMVPLFSVCLLGLAGLAFSLWNFRPPRTFSLARLAVSVLVLAASVGPLLAVGYLHRYTIALLATGLALQVGGMFTRRPLACDVFIRRMLLVLGAVVAVVGVTIHALGAMRERREIARLPSPAPDAPNVLIVTLDTVRAANLSLYGYERSTTPELEKLARRGVAFDSAISTSPWTLPAHASLFTGRYPHELSANWTVPLDGTYPVLAEALSSRGYVTAGFVSNLLYTSREHGLSRGFIHYEDYPLSAGQVVLSSSIGNLFARSYRVRQITGYQRVLNRKTAEEVNDDFLSWLSGHRDRPFFAFINYFDAHEPYLPPEPFDGKFGRKRSPEAVFFHSGVDAFRTDRANLPASELEAELNAYDGAIAYMDHQIGVLISELDRMQVLDKTLVVVTADHGEHFGEHRLFGHGNSLYPQLLHVPLVMAFPNHIPEGLRIAKPVSVRDLPATVLDIVQVSDQQRFAGRSLAWTWDRNRVSGNAVESPVLGEVAKNSKLIAEWYPATKGDMKGIVQDGYYFVVNGDGQEELYDAGRGLGGIPEQETVSDAEARAVLPGLRLALQEALARAPATADAPRATD